MRVFNQKTDEAAFSLNPKRDETVYLMLLLPNCNLRLIYSQKNKAKIHIRKKWKLNSRDFSNPGKT